MKIVEVEWKYLNNESYKYYWKIFSDGSFNNYSMDGEDGGSYGVSDPGDDFSKFIAQGGGKVVHEMGYCNVDVEDEHGECDLFECPCPYGFKNKLGKGEERSNNRGIIEI